MSEDSQSYTVRKSDVIITATQRPLTVRERFACQAMNGILAEGTWTTVESVAKKAVEMADAMIEELAK